MRKLPCFTRLRYHVLASRFGEYHSGGGGVCVWCVWGGGGGGLAGPLMCASVLLWHQGLDLAGQLIQRVMAEVQNEFPSVTHFSTLSPMPLMFQWWKRQLVR